MTPKYNTVLSREAVEKGYISITKAYGSGEHTFLDRVIRDLGNVPHLLVEFSDGIEVFRLERELNTIKP